MRSVADFLCIGGALLVLAAVALGAMLSVGSGWLSGFLAALFVIDSAVLIVIAGRLTVWRQNGAAR